MNDYLKKEWRNLLWLILLLISGVVTLRTAVSDVKEIKPKVERLEKFEAVQSEVNRIIEKKLDKLDEKIDRLLRR